MLLMKKAFFEGIRTGAKTTTFRYWRWCHVRPGSVQTVPGLGKVHIDAAEAIQPEDMTDDDARSDGFSDLDTLRRALEELYPPEKRNGRKLFRIAFTLLPTPSSP